VLKAEVEDPDDPGTALNQRLLEELTCAEAVIITGQALSHCIANTITDLIENLASDVLGRVILLEDTSSSVPGFEELGRSVLEKVRDAGMGVYKASEVPFS
jgi:nicotinamidase-related amidase